jgi:osomolarity two-component system, response regulator SKN7
MNDGEIPIQQMDLINQQLVAQSQQLEQLSQRYTEMAVNQQMVLQEVLRVQKTVLNHEHIIQNVMTFLHSVDAKQRRDSKVIFNTGETAHAAQLTPTSQSVPVPDDEPASPLQHASKLLNDLNAEVQFNVASMEQLHDLSSKVPGTTSTPPADLHPRNSQRAPQSADSSSTMGYARLNNGELDQVVYPMGSNNGIDPMYSEHVNNIPYSMPPKELDPSDPRRQYVDGRKKSIFADPGWSRPPRILLVEDDPTCRHIGGKFLYSFCCVIDSAVSLRGLPCGYLLSFASLMALKL